MNFRYTQHQVARGAFPDAQQGNEIYLFKRLGTLRATYQVRLLIFMASEAGKTLVIDVPKHFSPHPSLSGLLEEFPKALRIQKASR